MTKRIKLADCILPLDMSGLAGRMLSVSSSARKSAELLLVYDLHSSLEQWWGLARYLSNYGAVTMPDLPGVGGMQSMQRLGDKPSLDGMADYLAAFVKMHYKRRSKAVMVGVGFGFVVATRMLQRYPALRKHVQLLVSIDGVMNADDVGLSRRQRFIYHLLTRMCSYRLPAMIVRGALLNSLVLGCMYRIGLVSITPKANSAKIRVGDRAALADIWQWQNNDLTTYARMMRELLALDNCRVQVHLPICHVKTKASKCTDDHKMEQRLRVVFREVRMMESTVHGRMLRPVVDMATAKQLIPTELQRILASI